MHHATRFKSRTEPLLHLTLQQALQIARTPRGLQRERLIDRIHRFLQGSCSDLEAKRKMTIRKLDDMDHGWIVEVFGS